MLEVRDLRIGTKVKLSARGKEYYSDTDYNPHDVVGVYVHNDGTGVIPLLVVWPSLMHNTYEAEDLELA